MYCFILLLWRIKIHVIVVYKRKTFDFFVGINFIKYQEILKNIITHMRQFFPQRC